MKKIYLLLIMCMAALQSSAQFNLIVAADGSGNYTTVQAAINAATPGTAAAPFKIYIKKGKYVEKDTVHSSKVFLQLIGDSTGDVVISFGAAANAINPQTGLAYGTGGSATFTVNADNFTAVNITFENTVGRAGDGPQAVALSVSRDKCAFKNCRFIGGQDTIYANGNGKRQYFKGCYIDGNTDFIFGSAIALFDSCVVFGRDRVDGQSGGIITAASTPAGQAYGYVFRYCRIPMNRITTSYSLGRPWGNAGTPNPTPAHNNVVLIQTRMGGSIKPAGWDVWDAGTVTSVINYAEYNSRYFSGTPIDTSARVVWSRQLSAATAGTYTIANIFTNTVDSWDPNTIPGFNTIMPEKIALANMRVKRALPQLAISWNVCWPMTGIKYELFRSHDNISFAKVHEETALTDTAVTFFVNNALVAGQTQYYYYVKASKAGYATFNSDTIAFNSGIPLNGDFRSATSGNWSNGPTWEKYDAATSAWILQSGTGTSAYPGGGSDATIRTGHTVTFNSTSYFNSVTIDSAAVLNADATGRTVRVSSGIINSGLFGGPTTASNNITLEFPNSNTNVTLTGKGVFNLNRIRALTGLINASLTIDADITLYGNLAAWYNNSSVTVNERISVTINKGATVTLTAGTLHNSNQANTNAGGVYTYNIYGTLDMSSSAATPYFVPLSPASSALNINVGKTGLLKFGTRFSTVNTATTPILGKVNLTIADSGRVDASAVSAGNFDIGSNYWDISGNGSLSRLVDSGTNIVFPIRYAGSPSPNTITINNSGTTDVFTLGLRDTLSNLHALQTRYAKRQWNISEAVPGGSNASLSLSWTSSDQSPAFDPSIAYVRRYNGASWDSLGTTITGSGTVADPYVASVAGLSSFTSFGLFNDQDTLATPTGIKSFGKSNFMLIPNPAGAHITVAYSNAAASNRLDIYDMHGRIVLSQEATGYSGKAELNVAGLSPGNYFLQFSGNGQVLKVLRFVKQ